MASANGTIPRFLLPQLTWRVRVLRSFQLDPKPSSTVRLPPIPRQTSRRGLSSHGRTWEPNNRSTSGPFFRLRQTTSILRCHAVSGLSDNSLAPSLTTMTNIIFAKAFSTTRALARDHHFDTLKFVKHLKDEGFSEEQARAMMLVLSDVIEESIQNLTRTMVLKEGISHPASVLLLFLDR